MPIMEISIIPLGTCSTSLSAYVAAAERVLAREKGVIAQVTAMGTIVQGASVERLLAAAARMHQAVAAAGAGRIYTNIKLDDRLDKPVTIKGKLASLNRQLKKRTEK